MTKLYCKASYSHHLYYLHSSNVGLTPLPPGLTRPNPVWVKRLQGEPETIIFRQEDKGGPPWICDHQNLRVSARENRKDAHPIAGPRRESNVGRNETIRTSSRRLWLCSAEEFLELYGKVEAVVRNCLLRWSGHLVEVAGTPLFDQSFCFKHISLFCAPIVALFRWYPPFPCFTRDCEVTLNPCISITNQDFKNKKKVFLVQGLGNVSQKFNPSALNRKYRNGRPNNWYFWFYLQNWGKF